MKKETYTFAQILLALYQKYADNQVMLKKLKDYIEITPNKKIADANFVPRFEFYYQMPRKKIVCHDKLVKLEITEKLNLLKRIKEELYILSINFSEYDIIQYLRKLYYNIKCDENGNYQIKFKANGELTSINPQISVIHQTRFNELINEIINSELMMISRQNCNVNKMIGGWEFVMDAYYIGLRGPENKLLGIYVFNKRLSFYRKKILLQLHHLVRINFLRTC